MAGTAIVCHPGHGEKRFEGRRVCHWQFLGVKAFLGGTGRLKICCFVHLRRGEGGVSHLEYDALVLSSSLVFYGGSLQIISQNID